MLRGKDYLRFVRITVEAENNLQPPAFLLSRGYTAYTPSTDIGLLVQRDCLQDADSEAATY